MPNYFTISDFILFISIAVIGTLFFNTVPVTTHVRRYLPRGLGAALGLSTTIMVVEGIPTLF